MAEIELLDIVMMLLSFFAGIQGGGEAPMEGNVTRVIDGDTVELTSGNDTYDIRLLGVNTPETSTQYMNGFEVENLSEQCRLQLGDEAENALEDRIINKSVALQYDPIAGTQGSYDRYLAEIYMDGNNINRWLVEQGYGVATTESYDYSAINDRLYDESEDIAENQTRGVWAGC